MCYVRQLKPFLRYNPDSIFDLVIITTSVQLTFNTITSDIFYKWIIGCIGKNKVDILLGICCFLLIYTLNRQIWGGIAASEMVLAANGSSLLAGKHIELE